MSRLVVQVSSAVLCVQLHSCKLISRHSAPAAALIQIREHAQNYGAFTRDPFKTFQRKLARKQANRNTKVPLVSTERSQTELLLPINVWSLGEHVRFIKTASCPDRFILDFRARSDDC